MQWITPDNVLILFQRKGYEMDMLMDKVWETVKNLYDSYKKDDNVKFDSAKKECFKQTFENHYNDIIKRFMNESTEVLDSHKQAAILTISLLESEAISCRCKENEINIAPYIIAIDLGLSYMNECLQSCLKKKNIAYKDIHYILPQAIACDTPYIEIMSRLLYYEQTEKDMSFNILELADRYFLLEYITLLRYDIEPEILKD